MVLIHHSFDPHRFIFPDNIAEGYAWWLGREIENPDAVVLVAEETHRDSDEAEILGYTYGTIEDADWRLLLGPYAGFHDLWVEERARGKGIGKMLTEATMDRFAEMGARQVVLMTAVQNGAAQRLADSLGFRRTMIEMTRELTPATDTEPTGAARR